MLSESFQPTAHSPVRITNRQDLARYLDYCSEMLSITGKLAALFAQSVNDEVVVSAVNDVEDLGSNLSRKIWQKITMIENSAAAGSKRSRGWSGAGPAACRRRLVTSALLSIISAPMNLPTDPAEKSGSAHPLPFGHAGRRRRADGAGDDAEAARLFGRAPGVLGRRHAGRREPLCPPLGQRPASDVCRPYRRGACRRRGGLDASALSRPTSTMARCTAAARST